MKHLSLLSRQARRLAAGAALALGGLGAAAQTAGRAVFPFEELDTLARRAELVYGGAVRPVWLGSSPFFYYRNHEPGGDRFYLVDATDGRSRSCAARDSLALLLPAGADSLARFLRPEDPTHEPRGGERRRGGRGTLSPDGRWRAYVQDHNVWVAPADGKGQAFALSCDGTEGLDYGSLLWSPDSRRLAALLTRAAPVRRIPLLESAPADQVQPRLHWRDYAKPGDVLPVALPALFDVEGRRQVPLATDSFRHQFSLRLTGWRADSRAFTFEFNRRGHQRYVVAEVDARTGRIRPLADERSATFVDYTRLWRYDLDDGRQMLWLSERDGWRHLWLLDCTGRAEDRCLTPGRWVVRGVDRVDEASGTVFFYASGLHEGEDPYNVHYCRVDLDGGGLTDLTPEPANHVLSFSADRSRMVDAYSRPDLPPVSVVRDGRTGRVVDTLQVCDAGALLATGWTMPEPFRTKGRDGQTDIWGNIYRPANFDPSRRYPVVEDIYAGPHDAFVSKNFSAHEYYITPLTELGFIVVKIDGMGTNHRSKHFHDVCWKNLADAGLPDRIAWIRAAAERYPYMDTTRVGIYGWSAGGQNALSALLFHGDFYRAAVAFCGCHDNRMDKIWWNEQWMGYPVDSSYVRSSNVANAWRLQGDLLLVNGELDDNVDPASTLQVVKALTDAGKYFEQLYLPGRDHNLGGRYEVSRMYDFFVRRLRDRPAAP